jgi:phosphatidylinositol alpha-1,6-mannosyltransferase
MHLASLRSTHFVYDFAGMARAHPRLPILNRPYLLWMHGIELWEDTTAAWLERARSAQLLVSNSEYTRTRAQRLHRGLEHARVCWLATEQDSSPHVHSPAKSPNVLILSRIDAGGGYKGHRELIDAWPAVTKVIPDARLLIAGSGPGATVVEQWVRRSPARNQIELLGFVPEDALPQLWQRARVFAMPSRGEGFGIAYIEAMRHRLPVIASVHDAAPEINLHGETGFNVDLDTPSALAERLIEALDEGRALRLGEAGRARWHENFRYTCFRTRFIEVLDELLATS